MLPGKQKLVNQSNAFPILGWKKIFVPQKGSELRQCWANMCNTAIESSSLFKSKQVDRVAFTTLPVSYIFILEYVGQKSNSELM